MTDPVVVVGAGLAGLTAATVLRRHGVPVRVFEAGPHVAGLARSEVDADGFTTDTGAHFITNRLAAAVGVSARCRPMPRYGEAVWLRGRAYSYPFGLMRNPRFVASAAAAKVRGLFAGKPAHAAEWYRAAYGRKLADEVAIPITEAWSGALADELSAAVGDKFSTSLPRTIMLKLAGRLTGRTVAVGYSETVPESPHVWHVYPEGGIGAVCERLAGEVADAVETRTPVEAIHVENGSVVGVRAGGRDVATRAVVTTAPLPILAKLVRGTDALAHLAQFEYRAMAFVNLRFAGGVRLPEVVTWTPGAEFPFFRLTDIGLGLPWLVPPGTAQITADLGCKVGDATWTAADADLGRDCLAALEQVVPGAAKHYLGCRVVRTAVAYPVFRTAYEAERLRFAAGSGVGGLTSVGRNGEFRHILMEDVYWRTRRAVLRSGAVPAAVGAG